MGALTEQEELELLTLEKEKAFASTPGGAAVGSPGMERTPMPRTPSLGFGRAAAEVGGAGIIGGVMGYALPEILGAAGGAVAAFPHTARFAPWLSGMRSAAITAGRPAGAAAGAVSGLAGETAGQASEAADAPWFVSEGARLVAGGTTPALIRGIYEYGMKIPTLSIWKSITKQGLKSIVDRFEADPKSISTAEREMMDRLVAEVRGGIKTDQPQKEVFDALGAGAVQARTAAQGKAEEISTLTGASASRARALAQTEANTILANSEKEASQTISDAMKGDVAKRRAALPRLQEIGDNALEAARAQRATLGADREASDIGGELRQTIVGRNQAALEARSAEFKALEQQRDTIVRSKETARQYVNDLPDYKALVNSLKSELSPGTRSPDVASNFEYILRQVTNPEKDVFGQAKPISFQVLDDVRRQLGEVFKGNAPEGYKAIDAATARKYYAQISNIQKKFAGEPQERLLSRYAESSEDLQMFGSKAGKRATAVDRYDDERFATDAGMLPRQFFKSKQGIQDLIDLTGDKALVVKTGKEFAASELRDASESQVRSWMTKNRDWLTTSPEGREVWMSVSKYADALQRGERIAKNVTKGSKFVESSIESKTKEAERTAADIRRVGERQAGTIVTAGERQAESIAASGKQGSLAALASGEEAASTLVGNKFPVERVRQLIESGDREQWRAASTVINSSPTAKAALPGAIRQVIADRIERSPKGIGDFFDRNVRPAVEGTGLMSTAQADDIARQLKAIENMKLPEPERIGLAKRLLLQSVGGYAAGTIPRGLAALIPQ